jgi:hypothetical protein
MLGREDIGRTEEDYRHPNNYRHPVFQKELHPEIRCQKSPVRRSVFCIGQCATYNLASF